MRLTAKADDAPTAAALLDDVGGRGRAIVGDQVFGVDDDTMESVVLDLLRARGLTLGLAESVTGGLVGGRLTACPAPATCSAAASVSATRAR